MSAEFTPQKSFDPLKENPFAEGTKKENYPKYQEALESQFRKMTLLLEAIQGTQNPDLLKDYQTEKAKLDAMLTEFELTGEISSLDSTPDKLN